MPTILYCRCAYAQVINAGVKDDVLRQLCDSGASFESVADLCEMAAHRDPRLAAFAACASNGGLRLAACHERAVRGLFRQAGATLPESGAEVHNMREKSSDAVVAGLLRPHESPDGDSKDLDPAGVKSSGVNSSAPVASRIDETPAEA